MSEVTTSMALMDFIPVFFFGIGILYLLQIGYQFLGRNLYTAMAGGGVLCFVGGFYKATSKLLEAASGYCLIALETSQFIMLAPGFVLLFVAALGLLRSSPRKGLLAVVGMELWKIPFIAIMTLANLGFLVVMAVFASRNKMRFAAGLYIMSALGMLVMGYLSTQPFISAGAHWLSQSVNSLVQLLAMAGHITLCRGLAPATQLSNTYAGSCGSTL
jgi:hypothetical protein